MGGATLLLPASRRCPAAGAASCLPACLIPPAAAAAAPQANAEGSLLSDEELWTVLWEVASGLEFLHSHGVLHLDIKPENIYRRGG